MSAGRIVRVETRTDEPEQAHDAAKDLDDKDLDEEVGVRSVCECCGRSRDADADSAEEIAGADGEAAPEECESCM